MDLKESVILENDVGRHWYYSSKAAAMCRYLDGLEPSLVLDVGAGSGFFTKYLLEHTAARAGLCVDTGYATARTQEYHRKALQFQPSCDSVPADLVLLMDVLEHVEDDAGLLVEYVRRVPTGARFLLTVPAFQWLWSEHDIFLEHYRRYDLDSLQTVVRKAGLVIERCSYFFGLVLPMACIQRMGRSKQPAGGRVARSHLRRHHWVTNTLLASLCQMELGLLRMNRLGGLSVFCLATKCA
jgi:SAM-dependent methyltransferase